MFPVCSIRLSVPSLFCLFPVCCTRVSVPSLFYMFPVCSVCSQSVLHMCLFSVCSICYQSVLSVPSMFCLFPVCFTRVSVPSPSYECGDSGLGGGGRLCRQDVPPGVSHVRLSTGGQPHLVDRRPTAGRRLAGSKRHTAQLVPLLNGPAWVTAQTTGKVGGHCLRDRTASPTAELGRLCAPRQRGSAVSRTAGRCLQMLLTEPR